MSEIINVLFSSIRGSKHTVPLKKDFTLDDIKKVVKEKFNVEKFRLVVNGKEMRDDNPDEFNKLKDTIKNNTTIYVCQRMDGGMLGVDSHKVTIRVDLQDELRRVQTQPTSSACPLCYEDKQCIKYCCTIICKECFQNNFVHNDYKIVCLTCNQTLLPETVFITEPFIQSLNQLDETTMMVKHIDFQICTCGAFSINSTMYAKQKCDSCQRWLCFFCNEDWDENEKKMQNELYTCKVNCFWETKISYTMIEFVLNNEMKIPSRRCCPKCFEGGAYDQKCKYHICKCGHNFCFICLQSKEDCLRIHNAGYNNPCTDVAQQSFTLFPRLCRD